MKTPFHALILAVAMAVGLTGCAQEASTSPTAGSGSYVLEMSTQRVWVG